MAQGARELAGGESVLQLASEDDAVDADGVQLLVRRQAAVARLVVALHDAVDGGAEAVGVDDRVVGLLEDAAVDDAVAVLVVIGHGLFSL